MKKKWLTFSAGLAGLISCVLLVVLNIITVIALENLAAISSSDFRDWQAAVAIIAVISVIPIALNACAINVLTTEKYIKCKSKIITAIVFNFIVLLYNLIVVIGASFADWMIAVSVILIITLLACNVLYIVDMALKIKENDAAPVKNNNVSQDASKTSSEEEQLLNELEKLVGLRERKILTQEEFEKLKNQIIIKYVK